MKYNITEEQLKQIVIEELEAYMLEEGIMDFGKKIGRKAKGAAAGLAMMGALSGAPADVAAKPPTGVTRSVKAMKGTLKTDFKTGKVTYVSPDGKTITKNGRSDVSSNPKGAIKNWKKNS